MSLFEIKVSIIYKLLFITILLFIDLFKCKKNKTKKNKQAWCYFVYFSLKKELYSRRVASILIGLYPLWLEPIIEGKVRHTLFSRDSSVIQWSALYRGACLELKLHATDEADTAHMVASCGSSQGVIHLLSRLPSNRHNPCVQYERATLPILNHMPQTF